MPNPDEDAEWRAWVEALPCISCLDPAGYDIRHQLGQGTLDMQQRSPSGLPLACCRIWQFGRRGLGDDTAA
jgi:hypothetical protein